MGCATSRSIAGAGRDHGKSPGRGNESATGAPMTCVAADRISWVASRRSISRMSANLSPTLPMPRRKSTRTRVPNCGGASTSLGPELQHLTDRVRHDSERDGLVAGRGLDDDDAAALGGHALWQAELDREVDDRQHIAA